ncbi:glycosyltransferase family 2 protein [candidate division WWE3 bacterium]|uniref:Glycosyltransferase family 2 protein n=1 Tax=candidate division WWE3 bacterium TaxID=2053526 RepID=A0A955RQ87_UNCKA|nr:glycosyltransferase family 2 protein [candidate division WWE3 bacterium]
MNTIRISAIIPCRNEEKGITKVIDRLKPLVDEIVVVDNGSTDQTVDVARNAGARVFVENRKDRHGIGYGYAIQTGMEQARGEYIVVVDADGEHPVEVIPNLMNYFIDGNYDVISCNRVQRVSSKFISKVREFGMKLLNLEVKVFYGYEMKDAISGMVMIRKKAYAMLDLKEGGWDLSPEIKLSAIAHKRLHYGEYPIISIVRESGESKQILWKTGIQHATYIIKHWYQHIAMPKVRQLFDRTVSIVYDRAV